MVGRRGISLVFVAALNKIAICYDPIHRPMYRITFCDIVVSLNQDIKLDHFHPEGKRWSMDTLPKLFCTFFLVICISFSYFLRASEENAITEGPESVPRTKTEFVIP